MGKIRVDELAKKMGIPTQDLVFKLKSIGVRVEGEDAMVDSDILSAILQGKKLPHPREVILRDSASADQAPVRRRITPPRRMPSGPLRPNRPRTLIQRADRGIPTLPSSRKPEPKPAPEPPRPEPVAPEPPPVVEQATAPPPGGTAATAPSAAAAKPAAKTVAPAPAKPRPPKTTRSQRRAGRRKEERSKPAAAAKLQFKEGAPSGPVMISEGMTVREYAEKLGVKSKDLIKTLFTRGIMANINHVLDPELAEELATELGVESMIVSFEEEVQLAQESEIAEEEAGTELRAPVVTVMGHVDHGKTSLLDAIRQTRVADGEAGGITQHIGAYRVEIDDKPLVFLDTPGHEAFTLMRARGASATDIVVLMVAADDGVMPQTLEAIDHAKAAEVPLIVAINKIDKENANPDRLKKQLADNDLLVEDWGGEVVAVPTSAIKGEGIPELLEMIQITAEMLELKASPELPAQGVVLEAQKEIGRGIVATVLVQNGTLSVGDIFVAGATTGKVRAMTDDRGERLESVPPSTPVEVTGFSDVPAAGDAFQVVEDENKARSIASFRQSEERRRGLTPTAGKLSLEELFGQLQDGTTKELPVVLRGDVQGSIEVLKDTLAKLSTDRVEVKVIMSAVGAISTNDVILASASGGIIIGFNVRPEKKAVELADKEGVDIRLHTVIYELTDELKKAMVGLLEPEWEEVSRGRAEVREIFKVPKAGMVAGCHVVEGVVPRNAMVRLLRDNVVVYDGKIASLRRFKDDTAEVRSGFDCGISLERFQDVKPGDIIEAYVREEVAPEL